MVRTQIQLTDRLAERVRSVAEREHVSMAALIRQAVAYFLDSSPGIGVEDRYERALSIAGRFSSGTGNLSGNHDDHFVETVNS